MTEERIHKFVDEAGDPNFFGKGGVSIIGKDGVSLTFSLGMVAIRKPFSLTQIREEISNLASYIEANPYYQSVPSVKKRIDKYGRFIFHAKDDIPEIRKEFFDLLLKLPFTFQCVVGRKIPSIFINKHNKKENEFYADLLSHLLKDKVHKNLILNIAQRGKSTNDVNLELAVAKATTKFLQKNGYKDLDCNIVYNVQDYDKEVILTIVDYCLWSVQRVFEKGETRFYDYLLKKDFQVIDIYDQQSYNLHDKNGKKIWKNYYNKKNPLKPDNKISPSSS